jgi:peptidoglycan/LPS O-acetylase OafA/YrhL
MDVEIRTPSRIYSGQTAIREDKHKIVNVGQMSNISSATFADSKPHYQILNGLRGIAALIVIGYHIFEAFATSPADQQFNHGYLAVDFFFILSGFVIGYAYDDRWKSMETRNFITRRLIRLQPMVITGAVLGAITFFMQGSEKWDGTPVAPLLVMFALLLHIFLIPAVPGTGAEVRGNGEMYPLNGPSWSLFFEYIGNLLYAFFLRRLSTRALATLVALAGVGLASFAIGNLSGFGHLGVGWTLADYNLLGGFLRLLFAFSAGLLLSRVFKPVHITGAFWKCSLVIVVLLSMPYIGNGNSPWINGIYDAVCTIAIFPMLVYLGASGKITGKFTVGMCKFLGNISYPLYMVHYPFMYLFYSFVWKKELTFAQTWPFAFILLFGNILVAYLCLKMIDEPARKYLTKRFLQIKKDGH